MLNMVLKRWAAVALTISAVSGRSKWTVSFEIRRCSPVGSVPRAETPVFGALQPNTTYRAHQAKICNYVTLRGTPGKKRNREIRYYE
jgi:hypothetical protein